MAMVDMRFTNCITYRSEANSDERDMSLLALKVGRGRIEDSGIRIKRLRVTGGEPLMHPNFEAMLKHMSDKWGPGRRGQVTVHTTDVVSRIDGDWYFDKHEPTSSGLEFPLPMVSPKNLGIEPPLYGVVAPCRQQNAFGRLFDAHGFTFCVYAGALGRLLRIDPYHAHPVRCGIPEICQHCPYSISQGGNGPRNLIQDNAAPTDTYKKALDVQKDDGLFEMPLFLERNDAVSVGSGDLI